jgi:predicted dehydrogenase
MPEYVSPLVDRVGREMVKQWQFANSIHLIDLFRFFGGEVHSVATNNVVNGVDDRSYSALLSFVSGATGIYHAQWYAPGGWRLAVYGSDISVVFQPIEQAVVMERGHDRFPIEAVGPDRRFKPGLYGQARAFVAAVMEGKRVNGVSNLADYVRSVELVDAMTETRGFANRATLSAPAGTN